MNFINSSEPVTAYSNIPEDTDVKLSPSQIVYICFLATICLVGTIGNIMTIIAVKIERYLRQSLSNMFLINLAVADLLVCATVVPMMIAHVAARENLFGPYHCYATVVISGLACHTAAATMTCIAVTRFIAASRATKYHDIVTRKRVAIAVAAVWCFSALNTAPILAAWITTPYNGRKYVCVCFDGTFPLYYTLGPVLFGHLLPHAITIVCYVRLLIAIRRSRKRTYSSSAGATQDTLESVAETVRHKSQNIASETEDTKKSGLSVRKWPPHEMQLLKTSVWIIGFFSLCWIPYGVLILLQDLAPIALKKTFASLCLLSFSLNPMIYGFMSKAFRRAFLRMTRKVFCVGDGFDSTNIRTHSGAAAENGRTVTNRV